MGWKIRAVSCCGYKWMHNNNVAIIMCMYRCHGSLGDMAISLTSRWPQRLLPVTGNECTATTVISVIVLSPWQSEARQSLSPWNFQHNASVKMHTERWWRILHKLCQNSPPTHLCCVHLRKWTPLFGIIINIRNLLATLRFHQIRRSTNPDI
jgi:hypothetical protein